ncbi:MAG: tRNA (adenosine(37)-N6)-dimethylallyltransferase MiaA [Candidatus Dasytiphilus stammeri]
MHKIDRTKIAIFLMGPTASGKTELAIALRKFLPVEIISVDSALIYREMNIGTAKPSPEVLRYAPHRLVDIKDPSEYYSVANFCSEARSEMKNISQQGNFPLLVGGSMLYFKALLEGLSPLLPAADYITRKYIQQKADQKGWNYIYQKISIIDPISAQSIHPNDYHRLSRALEVFLLSGKTLTFLKKKTGKILPYKIVQFVLAPSCRYHLYRRIEERFFNFIHNGFELEVKKLIERGDLNLDMPSMRTVGYRQMWSYIKGNISYIDMINQGLCATRQLAKHQYTWLKKWQRKNIYWIDNNDLSIDLACNKVLNIIKNNYQELLFQ